MTEKQKNDVLYVCSLIETIARKTKNHRQDVIRHFTKAGIERQLRLAEVNHCLSFEQVSDELIEDLNIPDGDFDTAAECRYTVPSATSIGMLYQGLVLFRTVLFFWIPVHTITFLLPEAFRVLFAALLGAVLGLILAWAGSRQAKG